MKEEKFLHTQKLPHRSGQVETLGPQRECNRGYSEGKAEFTTEIVADQHLPGKMLLARPGAASMGWVLRALGAGP